MQAAKVSNKHSVKTRFIILQLLTIMLVAAVLVSFADVSLSSPKDRQHNMVRATNAPVDNSASARETADVEFEKKWNHSQKLLAEKQAKIDELQNQVKSLQSNSTNTTTEASAKVEELSASLQQLKLESEKALGDKDAKIRELESRVQTLQNAKNTNTPSQDNRAIVEKLKTDIQKLETRNALLVKLNSDLKKNNEYLSGLIKTSGTGN